LIIDEAKQLSDKVMTQFHKKQRAETNIHQEKRGGTKTEEIKTNDLRQITLNNKIDYIRQILKNLGETTAIPKVLQDTMGSNQLELL
jgi:uncharacterized protein YbcC (UPF0753/DUF2309 family)